MSERLVTHGTSNQTPTGPAAMGLGSDGKTYGLPLASGGGAIVTSPSGASPRVKKTVVGSTSSNAEVIPANGQNVIKFNVCKLRTGTTTQIDPILTDGNGGSTLWGDDMQALTNTQFGSNDPCPTAPDYIAKTSAGNAVWLNPGGQTVKYYISYWDSDAS